MTKASLENRPVSSALATDEPFAAFAAVRTWMARKKCSRQHCGTAHGRRWQQSLAFVASSR